MLDFVDITKDNVHMYCRFNMDFGKDLNKFQSKIYPHNSDFFAVMSQNNLLKWSYMFYCGRIIGALWLEKEHACLPVATLGIFIADKEFRNKGIGEKAIKLYIDQNREAMNLKEINLCIPKENIRTIKCCEKCGFTKNKEFTITNRIKAITMIRSF